MQTLSDMGATEIRRHEGFRGKAYRCPAGVLTIGLGFTWRNGAFREWWKRERPGEAFDQMSSMDRFEADHALQYIVQKEIGPQVSLFYGHERQQCVFDATVSVVYNLGPRALQWKWAKASFKEKYVESARKLTSTGITANKRVLNGLKARRKQEAELLAFGIYVSTFASDIYDAGPDPMADGVLVRGERGNAVGDLINDLHELGLYDGSRDFIFGHGTECAVVEFQRRHKLTADGKAGPETLSAIEKALRRKKHAKRNVLIGAGAAATAAAGGMSMIDKIVGWF